MRAFLQRVWARLSSYSADGAPLTTHNHNHDLEAYGHPDSDTIDLVCESGPPELGCTHPQNAYPQHTHTQHTHTQHTHTHTHSRISPFSEDHSPFSPRPPSPA
jgi:hypothetical protein